MDDLFSNLPRNLSKIQIPYQRLDFFKTAVASTIIPPRVKWPEYIKHQIESTDGYEIVPVTATSSLLNSILYAIYPKYEEKTWTDKLNLVSALREYLLRKIPILKNSTSQLDRLKPSEIEDGLCYSPNMQSLFYTALALNLNLVVLDDREINYYTPEKDYNASLILYQADSDIYYVVESEEYRIHTLTNSALLKSLYKLRSDDYCLPFFRDTTLQDATKNLLKLKLAELQELSQNEGLEIYGNRKGKKVKYTKKELVERLLDI